MSRERDRKLEQALKRELRATGTPDRHSCVDAETLAAWAEGGLDPAQMAAVEMHVSTCARCQAVAGATARSAPPAPEAESLATFSLWKWWLAPIAATAAAVTLWMVVPKEREVAVASPPPVAAPGAGTFAQKSTAQAAPSEQPPTSAAASPAAAADRAERANSAQLEREDRREQPAKVAGKTDRADPKPLQDKNAAGAVAQSAPRAMAADELQNSARISVTPVEIVSPDPSRRWRIAGVTLQRTQDSGATWTALLTVGDSLTGGVAPTSSSCWLIGRAGLVMLSTDGITFARVPLHEAVDLAAITATDARSAIVTTADGRRFRTDDSGRTWRQI